MKRKLIGLIIINVAVIILLCFVVEGMASYVYLMHDLMTTYYLAERRHGKHDANLGWVNEPNTYIPDMYGPGVYLRTNGQGFRNDHDFSIHVPKNKSRIICSGDSFTVGYGVDNDHTWCELLTELNPGLETLNAGMGGYGLDQAYLRYRLNASRFDHQAHIMAFITSDFYRMLSDRFYGYRKPVIRIENDMLVVKNVPVPQPRVFDLWLGVNQKNLNQLRTVHLGRKIVERLGLRAAMRDDEAIDRDKLQELVGRVFQDLKQQSQSRGNVLILLFLPMLYELKGDGPKEWILFVEHVAKSSGIPIINLFSAFRSLSEEEQQALYIGEGVMNYVGAAGHFTNKGNEFVARQIDHALKHDPQFASLAQLLF